MTRIVWFHPRPLYPAANGGDVRTAGLIECATLGGHEVLLVVPGTGPHPDGARVPQIELVRPRPLSLAAKKVLSNQPLRSPRTMRQSGRSASSRILQFQPELAVVSEVMAWSMAKDLLPPGTPWIYDAHNIESTLFADLARGATGMWARMTFAVDAFRVRRVEKLLLQSATLVTAVSEADAAGLRAISARRDIRIHVVPSSVPSPRERAPVEQAGPSALFVGTLDYAPNVDAIEELITQVWPRIRATSPARLIVVGRRPSRRLRELIETVDWVELHENAADLEPFYRSARCVVLPLRSGGGTKLKVYEALAYGAPLVATPEAVAGIDIGEGEGVEIASDPPQIAERVLALMRDPGSARALSETGRGVFLTRLSWETGVKSRLLEAVRLAVSRTAVQ